MNVNKLMVKHGITEADLKNEYASRYWSEYLEECTEAELIDLMIDEQVYAQ